MRVEVQRLWDDNNQCSGVVKAWKQLKREGFEVARCTVERLMRQCLPGSIGSIPPAGAEANFYLYRTGQVMAV